MRLEDSCYENLKESVIDLFEVYGVTKIPIDPFAIANKLNIICIPYSMLSSKTRLKAYLYSKEGYLLNPKEDEWVIFYNDMFAIGTINNTIMHEIGHYWLGHKGENIEQEESEASFFAKYALTPPIIAYFLLDNVNVQTIQETFVLSSAGAIGAYEYYRHWFNRRNGAITSYEEKTLQLFKLV